MPGAPRFVVVQDGSRLHYAIPLALQAADALERIYSPLYVKGKFADQLVALFSSTKVLSHFRRLRHRRNPDLDDSKIFANYLLALTCFLARRRFSSIESFAKYESSLVGSWIRSCGYGAANLLFGFVRNVDPDLCRDARARGLSVVVDQMISTRSEERREARLQAERFPHWVKGSLTISDDSIVSNMEENTWAEASLVTCPSDYVRRSLVAEGVQASIISVIPYPIDVSHFQFVDRTSRVGPVMVGFTGSVSLRKGIPYLLQVARKLFSSQLQFVLVGPLGVDVKLIEGHSNVRLIGWQSKPEVIQWLSRFDIFFFPSTNEGSPGSVMEAMATGLPVVTTHNSGTVVRHSVDGFVHDYDDIDSLAASLELLAYDSSRRLSMGRCARDRALDFSVHQYADRLLHAVLPLCN
jgi:glycosyltransferase involved in cell wall biosynthesis